MGISPSKLISMTTPILAAGLLSLQGMLGKRKEESGLKNIADFLPASLEWNSEHHIYFFLLIKEFVS